MPDAPPAIYTPPSPGSPPSAPAVVYTPPSPGSPPSAPAVVYTPPGGGGAPTAPAAIYTPPVAGVAATALVPVTYTVDGIELVIGGGLTYVFTSDPPSVPGEVSSGETLAEAAANLVEEINGNGISPPDPLVSAVVSAGDDEVVLLTARQPGTGGNAIDLDAPSGGYAGMPATLTGGTGVTLGTPPAIFTP